jgi:putative iron-regulated protein
MIGSTWRSLLKASALTGLVAIAAVGCSDGRDETKDKVIAQYVAIVRASYDDSISGAKALRAAIADLVKEPSQKTLDAARTAWIDSRPAYLQTEAYRFYQGPIDFEPTDDSEEGGPEGRINAWPLDENFIDYVAGEDGRKGIINDRKAFPEITKQTLIDQNEKGGEANIASGYHAIEFLLWGQDTNNDGPGTRPFTDYAAGQAGADPDADRRRQYLGLAADLLIEDLSRVRDAWNDGEPYLKAFLANQNDDSLEAIVTGITALAGEELAGERLQPAYDYGDQEDEHSCFSDNTLNDMKYDLVGIKNVYLGQYGDLDGPGLQDLVRKADPQLDTRIQAQLKAAKDAIDRIPAPFDQTIKEENPRTLRAAIDALNELHSSLAKIPL